MTKTVSQHLIGFLNDQIKSTHEKHRSALSKYAEASVQEKIAKYNYEKNESCENLETLKESIVRSVDASESLKECGGLYRDALRELSLVKKPMQHLELRLDHHLASLQTKLEKYRGIFQSKLMLLKSGRKSLAKRMGRITKIARIYYTLALHQHKNFKKLESALKSLIAFETNVGLQAKLPHTTQSIITSKQELKEAKRDVERFVKLAKRHGADVDLGLVLHDDSGDSANLPESDQESADDSDEDSVDGSEPAKKTGYKDDSDEDSDGESDGEHDGESDTASESSASEDESEDDASDSDSGDDASDSESDDETGKGHRGARKHKAHAGGSGACYATRTPTLTDYLTNNPFDFYAKFIQPRIPQSSMNSALDLLGMLTAHQAAGQSATCKKPLKINKPRHSNKGCK